MLDKTPKGHKQCAYIGIIIGEFNKITSKTIHRRTDSGETHQHPWVQKDEKRRAPESKLRTELCIKGHHERNQAQLIRKIPWIPSHLSLLPPIRAPH